MKTQLIDISLADIRASRLLYDRKLYPQSFFYFQQATEKAFKAFGLITEAVDEVGIKKDIGHNPLKIYRKMVNLQLIETREGAEFFKKNEKVTKHEFFAPIEFEEYLNSLQEEIKILDRLGNIDLFNIDHDEIIDILEHLEEIEKTKFNPPPKKYLEEFKKGMHRYGDFLSTVNPASANEFKTELAKDGALDEVLKYTILYFNTLIQLAFVSKVFYFSSIVTSKHIETSRYSINNINPLEFYTKRLPIVKFQPDFLRLLEKAVKKLKKLYELKS